jgi:hypothetical protein
VVAEAAAVEKVAQALLSAAVAAALLVLLCGFKR